MRFHALATDYDGTLAHDGVVREPTLAALERLRATGRKLILVSGRELPDLERTFPHLALFDLAVLENGALLYRPSDKESKTLAAPPPESFVRELKRRGVAEISVGNVIVATWQPYETIVLEVIRDQGLDLQVIFNKDAVMVLPAGVNKATGLVAALADLGLSLHETVAVGDAENDQAFLAVCACAVAVANALPSVKERSDWVTPGDRGTGVTQLIDRLVRDDLASLERPLARHHLALGKDEAGAEVGIPPFGRNLLIAGPSGSGKSTVATALLERLQEGHYQVCIVDPEGDYEGLENALCLGDGKRPPVVDEVVRVLEDPTESVVVNLIGMPVADRPPFFLSLLPRLLDLRARTGRPHWLLIDEAHHLLPVAWEPGRYAFPPEVKGTLFVTVHPDQIAPSALATVDTVISVGPRPAETFEPFCRAAQIPPPKMMPAAEDGGVFLWSPAGGLPPQRVAVTQARAERHRHVRKYAEGELPPDRSFYFRGPEGKLNLRAQNLILFMQLADGVDDETWLFHLREGDYTRWFRERIKDDTLADEAGEVEKVADPQEGRAKIKEIIGRHYTLPAKAPLPVPGTDAAPKRPG